MWVRTEHRNQSQMFQRWTKRSANPTRVSTLRTNIPWKLRKDGNFAQLKLHWNICCLKKFYILFLLLLNRGKLAEWQASKGKTLKRPAMKMAQAKVFGTRSRITLNRIRNAVKDILKSQVTYWSFLDATPAVSC